MRGTIPDLLSAYIGNTILLYGFALETISLTTVGRLEKRWGTIYFSIATVGIAIFWLFASTSNLWVGYASLTTMTLFLVMSVSMACAPASSLIRKIIGLFYGIAGLALAARAWSGFFSGSEFALMSRSLIQTIAFAATFLTLIVSGIGFLLLFKEQADKLIDESEKKYRTLVERANESICIIQEGRFVFTNGKLEELLGVSQDNLIGRSFTDFIFQDDMEMVASYYESIGKGRDIPDIYNFRVMNHEGKPIWVQISSTLIEYGGKQATLALISNINRRKLAEEAMLTQNETFTQVLNSLDALIYVVDMKTYEIVFINTYGQNIWGDIEGKICWQTIQTGRSGPCEFCTNSKLVGPDGNPTQGVVWEFQNTVNKRLYNCRDRAIYWPDGRIVRMEIATDITMGKQAEEKLEEEHRQLQQAFDEIRTLRGIVPICAYCKKIRDDTGYWNQVEKYVSDHTDAKFSHGICPACFEREMKGIKGET
jgi:PAS domain S-box-containing protein